MILYIRDLGTFASFADLWAAHPEGGQEGDYATVGGVRVPWNKYTRNWGEGSGSSTPGYDTQVFQGDVVVNRNLIINGTLRAHGVQQPNQGLFETSDALAEAVPEPKVGDYAYVGDGFPAEIWVCRTAGTWVDSGETFEGEGVDLSSYVTKSEFQTYTEREDEVDDVVIGMGRLVVSLFKKSAFLSNDAETDINALESLLSGGISRIVAVYDQGGTIYAGQSLDDLRPDLVVTAYYLDGTSGVITTYTLSGTLLAGTSTITVSFGGKTATITVSVTAAVYYRDGSKMIRPYFLNSSGADYGPATVDGVTLVYTRSKNSSNIVQVSRACYPYFDLDLVKGTSYKWMVKTTGLPTGCKMSVALQYHNQAFKTDGLANNNAAHTPDIFDSGWLASTINNGVISFTYGAESASSSLSLVGARLNLRLLDSSDNDIAWPDGSSIDALIIQTV